VKPPPAGYASATQATLKTDGNAGKLIGASTFNNMKILTDAGARPASVLVFNGGGSGYGGQDVVPGATHVATVLRVSDTRLQFIDTGVVIGSEGEVSAEGGTVDHSFLSGAATHGESVVAFGFAKYKTDGELTAATEKLIAAKPLGFTRLVIATGNGRVLFVSKLLHMRWSIPKLIWSLRGLPVEDLRAAWLVWAPLSKSASTALADSPGQVAAAEKAEAEAKPEEAEGAQRDLRLANRASKPSALLSASDDAGRLTLANVLITADKATDKTHQDLHVYRAREILEWRVDFSATKLSSPGEIKEWKLGDDKDAPSLLKWCENSEHFHLRWLRTTAAGDTGAVGDVPVQDSLVDP
jgi:hypothetical protein